MLLSADAIFLHQALPDQAAVFRFLADQAVALGVADQAAPVLASLSEREALGTTGMMDGFAIPHAKDATIQSPKVVIVQLAQGIDWQSLDGQPVDFVLCLLIPDTEAGTTHLKVLSQLARLLMRQPVKDALKAALTPDDILAVLGQALNT